MSYKVTDLGSAMEEVAKLVNKDCDEILKQSESVIDKLAKDTIAEMKKVTPNRVIAEEPYKNCFVKRKRNSGGLISRVVWNKQYQLSHLLESGHMVYTRPKGSKRRYDVAKLGPFKIKRRTAQFGKAKNNMTTKAEGFWQVGQDYIEANIFQRLKDKIENN